jgi:basic amino acid/polyamine antiporter, APA family
MKNKENKLGLCALTALVAGNMIGSGIFMLPSELARIGSITLFSWVATAFGAFCLALVFSKMSILVPKNGGPYAYAQAGFGDFIGFQTAYYYWIAIWVGNCGIVVALIGYLRVFFPELAHPYWGALTGIGIVWLITAINITGVSTAGIVQLVTTILKFIPILLVAVLGWCYFHPEYITQSFNLTTKSNFSAFSYGATLTLWAFLGVESATIPAGSVNNPTRNIPLATLLGTSIAAVVYIASSAAIMGMLPASLLADAVSPFAAAAKVIFGKWGEWLIAAGACISCFGTLNGWILVQGQVPMAAADDNLFPKIFAKRNKRNIPIWGLIITSICISVFLLLSNSPDLVKQFQVIILVASVASLVAYLYTAIAEIILLPDRKHHIFHVVVAILAVSYSFWAIFSSGKVMVFYVTMLIFTGIPAYIWVIGRKRL